MSDMQMGSCCLKGCRDNLEDALGAINIQHPLPTRADISIAVVADGVGGNCNGEVASNEAVRAIKRFLASALTTVSQEECLSPDTVKDLLTQSMVAANNQILSHMRDEPALQGMATTVVCAIVAHGILHVGWAGDSRCYLYSQGTLEKLTVDHTEAQLLVDQGLLDEEYANTHPLSHTINQFLGMDDGFKPQITMSSLVPGDAVLLVTDGLTGVLSDEAILSAIHEYQKGRFSLKRLPQHLGTLALDAGSTDNVTVLCCEYVPERITKFSPLDSTLTGAYPAELAESLHRINKESQHV